MNQPRIPVAGPWITEAEVSAVARAAREEWYADAGHSVRAFEAAFAARHGRRYAIALPSCTAALHLALVALGIGPGDRVAVPELTWIASAAPVTYVGAEPVFVDVNPQTWCMDTDAFAEIAPDVRAVIPVDLYGGTPDFDAIEAIAATHGVHVLEDAAQAVGTTWRGRPAGQFGVASAFSFHGSKTLTTGEGGMLVTDDAALHERGRFLANHGRHSHDTSFISAEIAFKYQMTSMQAAMGLAQLERLDELVARKREIFGWYEEGLEPLRGRLALNAEPPGLHNSYWMVTVVLDDAPVRDKFALVAHLDARGIDARPMFSALSSLPAYAGAGDRSRAAVRNRVAYDIGPRGVNLPSGLNLTPELVARVCAAVSGFAGTD